MKPVSFEVPMTEAHQVVNGNQGVGETLWHGSYIVKMEGADSSETLVPIYHST